MDFLPVVKRIIRQTGASCPLELVMPQLLGLQMHATIVTRVVSKLTWCSIPIILVLQRLRQEDRVLEAGPCYIVIAYLK